MTASVNIPSSYTITLGGGLALTPIDLQGDPDRPIATQLTGDPAKPIATLLAGDPARPLTTTLQGNPDAPLSAAVELLNLPRLSLEQLKDLTTPKLRLQMPNYEQLCFKIFGVEIFSLCLSGEIQLITQPYEPNPFERCEPDCPEEDTRPFPDDTRIHAPRDV